jgi:acyl-ACP thioesterase
MHISDAKAMYYDCDVNNRLKLSAAMKYMQQASSEQMEVLGMSPGKLFAENMVFLLSKSCIRVRRQPTASERLRIATAPVATRGARFVREFRMESVQGEELISAYTLWILLDISSRKILRPASFPYEMRLEPSFLGEDTGDMAIPRLPPLLGEGENRKTAFDIRYSQLDVNRHVNNSVYADFICDSLEYEDVAARGIEALAISFQNEAALGDRVEVTRSAVTPSEYYLNGSHQGSACFEAYVRLGDRG